MTARDPRLTLARPDLAARALRGVVEAARFAEPRPMTVTTPLAPLMRQPGGARGLDSELLMGERFDVLDAANGWCWGQSVADGYVGFVPEAMLAPGSPAATHRVAALTAHLYPEPDIKTRPTALLPRGARLAVAEEVAAKGTSQPMARLGTREGYVIARHLAPVTRLAPDWVAEAESYLGVPYLWGGRSAFGLDCSALLQLARQAAGHGCPRDSDMQEAGLGEALAPDTPPARGDLVSWRGHVGIMLDGERLLHANAHHMAVAIEPVAETAARIARTGGGPVTRHARLDAAAPAR